MPNNALSCLKEAVSPLFPQSGTKQRSVKERKVNSSPHNGTTRKVSLSVARFDVIPYQQTTVARPSVIPLSCLDNFDKPPTIQSIVFKCFINYHEHYGHLCIVYTI